MLQCALNMNIIMIINIVLYVNKHPRGVLEMPPVTTHLLRVSVGVLTYITPDSHRQIQSTILKAYYYDNQVFYDFFIQSIIIQVSEKLSENVDNKMLPRLFENNIKMVVTENKMIV